jgi:hypothetical protein
MKSHELAKILLEKPNVPVVVKQPDDDPYALWIEATSVAYTNCCRFIDNGGFDGDDDYDASREAIEIK